MKKILLKNKSLSLNTETNFRRIKLLNLRKETTAFPNNFRKNAISDKLRSIYGNINNENLLKLNIKVNVAGRIINRRIMGKVSFIILKDIGGKIQLYIARKNISCINYDKYFKKFDIGDILGASGKLFKTKTGELTVRCYKIYLLTKSIRPLPEKFHGLVNKEIKYRQRYLDLISNSKSLKVFKMRSKIISEIRYFMIKNKFIEVETPMMHSIPGGANACPFITHYNTLNIDMYLRISPELYLKKLIVSGFERIFEMNRSFRNEGISSRHNPEFTTIELYMAYTDYIDMMIFLEDFFLNLVKNILDSNIIKYDNKLLNFNPPFVRMTMKEAICYYCPKINFKMLDDIDYLIKFAKSIGIKIEKYWELGKIQTKIFEEIIEKFLIQPTFITSFPIEVSPLARRNNENPFFSDRFEFFINGYEIGNGFSELNDSEDQAMRFLNQLKIKNIDNNTNIFYDENYITSLEYGLPPTSGLGVGIDRLIMLFTNSKNIRDVVFFPTLKSFFI
ncbi:MAG: lysine--tRNA ligase [gamma proteobacterium endosymbiont of Trioza apicalis]